MCEDTSPREFPGIDRCRSADISIIRRSNLLRNSATDFGGQNIRPMRQRQEARVEISTPGAIARIGSIYDLETVWGPKWIPPPRHPGRGAPDIWHFHAHLGGGPIPKAGWAARPHIAPASGRTYLRPKKKRTVAIGGDGFFNMRAKNHLTTIRHSSVNTLVTKGRPRFPLLSLPVYSNCKRCDDVAAFYRLHVRMGPRSHASGIGVLKAGLAVSGSAYVWWALLPPYGMVIVRWASQ